MKQSVKAVLFDLDDTLWAIGPVLQRAESQLFDWLRQHAPRLTSQHSVESLRERRQALLAAEPAYQINLWALRHAVLTQALHESNEEPALADPAMIIFTNARNSVEPFDDVVPGLQQLAQRLVLGTISNGFADLKHIGLADHFHTSIAAHQFGSAKPDPAIFHAACDALQLAPAEVVYVGDDLTLDVLGAQQAGLQAVWMNRFERTLPPHVQPDAICTNLYELDAWLTTASDKSPRN